MERYKALKVFCDYLLAVLMLLALWELAAALMDVPYLPGPPESLAAFYQEMRTDLWTHLLVSTSRVVVGLLAALIPAAALGMLLGRVEKLDRYAAPLVYLTYPVPKIVFLPLIIALLGLGDPAKIFLISIIVFFQILVTTRDASRQVDKAVVDSILSLGAGELHIYRHVVLPACLPKIFTALRISLGTAIAVLFFSETVASRTGIGYYVMDAWARLAWEEMFAGIIAMGAMGIVLYLLLDWLERKICPWEFI